MAVTDEEVERERERVTKLRDQVADKRAKVEERAREMTNEITMAQLRAEAAELEVELGEQHEQAKVSTARAGAAPVVDQAKERQETAEAQAEAQKEGE